MGGKIPNLIIVHHLIVSKNIFKYLFELNVSIKLNKKTQYILEFLTLAKLPFQTKNIICFPNMAEMDLSHLTPAERAHIEAVMIRQKQEEAKENEIMRFP